MNPVYKPLVYQQIPSNYSNFVLNQEFGISNKSVLISSNRLQHINCVIEPTNQLGGVFLGDIVCLLKPQLLEFHKIRSILTCMIQPISKPNHNSVQNHKIVFIRDSLEYPILNHFQQTFQFISKMRKQKKNILIHCHAGVSRSATILCAYLIQENQWNPHFALNHIRQKRERAKPNINFLKQLQYFYNEVVLPNKLIQNSKRRQKDYKTSLDLANQSKKSNFNIKEQKQSTINKIEKKQLINQNKINKITKRQSIVLQQQIQYHSELLDLQQKQKSFSKIGRRKARIPFEKDNQYKQNNLEKQDNYQTKEYNTNSSQLEKKNVQIAKYQNRINLSASNLQVFGKPLISKTSVSQFCHLQPKQTKFEQYYHMGSFNVNQMSNSNVNQKGSINVNQNYNKRPIISNIYEGKVIKIANQYQTPQKQKKIKGQNFQNGIQQQQNRRWSQKLPIYQYRRNW